MWSLKLDCVWIGCTVEQRHTEPMVIVWTELAPSKFIY